MISNPTRARVASDWLHGGDPPACTTVAEGSWTTTVGAQLFSASPEQLDEEAYARWQAENNLVYVPGGGGGRLVIVTPPGGTAEDC